MSRHPVDETRALFRALVFRRVAIGTLTLTLAFALGVILYGVVAIRSAQMTNTGTLNTTSRLLHLFIDCTSVKGECFQRSQRRTGQLVGGINEGSRIAAAAAAACAARPDIAGYAEIKACIDETLAHPKKKGS